MSDIHCEFYADQGTEFIKSVNPIKENEILVLAGDISTGRNVVSVLTQFAFKWPHVIFVAGNHEYYGNNPNTIHQCLQNLPTNVHYLRQSDIVIDGIQFLGTTLWFPFNPDNIHHEYALSDFHHIKQFNPWVYEENSRATAFLRKALSTPTALKRVVVTHHLPSYEAVHPRYKGSTLNRFFVDPIADQPDLPLPDLWVFGHTHNPCRFVRENCTFVCNPFGYPNEPKPLIYPTCLESL